MTKTQMIALVAEKTGVSKRLAGDMVNAFLNGIVAGVKKNGKVSFTGFGTFGISNRKARTGVNPRTGASIQIPAMKLPKFKAGKAFKAAIK